MEPATIAALLEEALGRPPTAADRERTVMLVETALRGLVAQRDALAFEDEAGSLTRVLDELADRSA